MDIKSVDMENIGQKKQRHREYGKGFCLLKKYGWTNNVT